MESTANIFRAILESDDRMLDPCVQIIPRTTPPQWIYEDTKLSTSYLTIPYIQPGDRDSVASPQYSTNVLVISIHGTCKSDDLQACKAAFGACSGSGYQGRYVWGLVPDSENQSRFAAELYAVRKVIERAEDVIKPAQPLPVIIIRTHSLYIAKCLGLRSFYDWARVEMPETIAEAITSKTLCEAVDHLIVEAEAEGRFKTKFWLVAQEHNQEAIALANEACDTEKHDMALNPNPSPLELCQDFWVHKAHLDDDTKQLCRRLGISLPRSRDGGFTRIQAPIRRLIARGEDNSKNFDRLFGPSWNDADEIKSEWWTFRREILQYESNGSFESLPRADLPDYRPRKATREDQKSLQRSEQGNPLTEPFVSGDMASSQGD